MLNLFRRKMPYEELGYGFADALLPSAVEQLAASPTDWTGKHLDTQGVGRELAILALAMLQMSLIDTVPQEYASSRVLGGFMQRVTERYTNFAFDPTTSAVGMQYIQAAANDLRNKQKTESFPTLVPRAVARIAGLTKGDEYWPLATECIYSFIQLVLQTAAQAVAVAKANTRLV
jgi:hypothetical protein